eukprot:9765440-Ditylum_brightwellii.AAC.1
MTNNDNTMKSNPSVVSQQRDRTAHSPKQRQRWFCKVKVCDKYSHSKERKWESFLFAPEVAAAMRVDINIVFVLPLINFKVVDEVMLGIYQGETFNAKLLMNAQPSSNDASLPRRKMFLALWLKGQM